MNSDPEGEAARSHLESGHYFNELFIWRLAAFFFTLFSRCLSDSVHLNVESRLLVDFLGALDGQQLSGRRGLRLPISSEDVDIDTLLNDRV